MVQDISVDALAIKELKIPHLVALLQGVCQKLGTMAGALLIIKGTSTEFSESIGLSHTITSAPVIFRNLAISLISPLLLVHIFYK